MTVVRRWLEAPESLDRLDRPAAAAQDRVRRMIKGKPIARLLSGEWLGHPVHPLAVQVPIGLWLSAGALDVLGQPAAARRLIGLGLLATPAVVAAGWVDFTELDDRQRRVGIVHAGTNAAAAACFAASYGNRLRGRVGKGRLWSMAGLGAIVIGGSLGGHLAYAQGAGVFRWTRRGSTADQRLPDSVAVG